MFSEKANSVDAVAAQVIRGGGVGNEVTAGGVFLVECFDKDGNLKWQAEKHNLVVNVGLKDMNDKYFLGAVYSAGWFLGLYGEGSTNNPAAADTAASHTGWTELTGYTQATRPAAVFVAATEASPSVITNAASPAQFSINATALVGGAFLISDSTKGGTTGILFSAADFQAPGDRAVTSGDILNVTYQFSLNVV